MRYFNSVRSDGKILKRNGVSWSLRSQKLQENLVLWKEWIFSALLINSFQNCKVEACSHFILACEWCFTLYSYRLWAHSLFDMIDPDWSFWHVSPKGMPFDSADISRDHSLLHIVSIAFSVLRKIRNKRNVEENMILMVFRTGCA